MNIATYGSNFKLLPATHKINNNIETIEILSHLPNTLILAVTGKTNQPDDKRSVKLLGVSLAGIPIDKDILSNKVEYRPDTSTNPEMSVQDYFNCSPTYTRMWNYNGCVLINFFDPDPFAYLLKIGNKIKF
jgi:hypothetical protein